MEKQAELAAKQHEMQHLFASLSQEQRSLVVNYLNSYNLTAWLYNELLDDTCRDYIDEAMKFTIETQNLDQSMSGVSGDSGDVQEVVDHFNLYQDGEESCKLHGA